MAKRKQKSKKMKEPTAFCTNAYRQDLKAQIGHPSIWYKADYASDRIDHGAPSEVELAQTSYWFNNATSAAASVGLNGRPSHLNTEENASNGKLEEYSKWMDSAAVLDNGHADEKLNYSTMEEPLPSGKYTISPQHPPVVIPRAINPNTFQTSKIMKELQVESYDYAQSPDTVLGDYDRNPFARTAYNPTLIATDEQLSLQQPVTSLASPYISAPLETPDKLNYANMAQSHCPVRPPMPLVDQNHLDNQNLNSIMISHILSNSTLGTNQGLYPQQANPFYSNAYSIPPQMVADGQQVHAAPCTSYQPQSQALFQTEPKGKVSRSKTLNRTSSNGERPRTSKYRGVSKHRLTKRWEASCWVHRKQLYLGGFDSEEKAARAYDVAALVCKGETSQINFHISDYVQHMKMLKDCTQEELVAHIRRQSSAFSRGKSRYRGVSGHAKRWEARIGQYNGRKNVSFGVYESEEEAAKQYDRALIIQKGRSAKTNFDIKVYENEIKDYLRSGKMPGAMITLPLSDSGEKKRSAAAVVYAEHLRKALKLP